MDTEDILANTDFGTAALVGAELHRTLGALRERAAIVRVRFFGSAAFLITRFDDIRRLLRDDEGFPGGRTYEIALAQTVGRTFIGMDGTEHDRYRQLATPAFRSGAVARFNDEQLAPLAHEIVDRFAARGRGDLVAEFTKVLPFYVISRKLGLPIGTEEDQRRWAKALLGFPRDQAGARAGAEEFTRFLAPVVAQRRRDPGDDVLSGLLAASHEGLTLTDAEVFSHVRLLYAIGATTTSDEMGNLLSALLTHPEILDRARLEPEVRPRVVLESLRWEPPVALLPRHAPLAGRIAGMDIPAASTLLVGIAAANRDPQKFMNADGFDPDRGESEILTFGLGRKFCPGVHLARTQLLTALDVLLERLPGLRLVDRAGSAPGGATLRAPEALWVEWED